MGVLVDMCLCAWGPAVLLQESDVDPEGVFETSVVRDSLDGQPDAGVGAGRQHSQSYEDFGAIWDRRSTA